MQRSSFETPQALNDVIDDLGMGPYQVTNMILLSGLVFVDGSEMLLASGLVTSMSDELYGSPMERGFAVSAIFLGLFLGGLIGGAIGDLLGRRCMCLVAYALICSFGLLCSIAWSMSVAIAFRFLMGIGVGIGVPSCATMLTEILPKDCRSLMFTTLTSGLFSAGQIWAAVGLMVFMPELVGQQWRALCIWGVVPSILLFPFAFLFLDESPRWLLVNGKKAELEGLLRFAALRNGKPTLDTVLDDSAYRGEDGAIRLSVRQRIGELFRPDLRRTTIICVCLCFLGNLMFYGQSYALAQEFRKLRGVDWLLPATELLMTSVFTIPGMAISTGFIVSSAGHRQSLAICAFLACLTSISMIVVDYGYAHLYDGSVYLYVLIVSAFFNLVYVYVPEAYPSIVRQTACGFCMSAGRIGSIGAPILFEYLHKHYDSIAPFLLVVASAGSIGTWLTTQLTQETKGMPLAEFNQREAKTFKDENDMGTREVTPLLSAKRL